VCSGKLPQARVHARGAPCHPDGAAPFARPPAADCFRSALDGVAVLLLLNLTGRSGRPLLFLVVLPVVLAFVLVRVRVSPRDSASRRAIRDGSPTAGHSAREVQALEEKTRTLYVVVQAIVAKQAAGAVLRHRPRTELARVMGVEAISVKLLSEDGRRSPVTRRAHASQIARRRTDRPSGQSRSTGAGSSVRCSSPGHSEREIPVERGPGRRGPQTRCCFVPLKAQFEVIGVLGAYSARTDQFEEKTIEFFRLRGGTSLATRHRHARAYEA